MLKILCSNLHPHMFNVKEIYAAHKCDIIILSCMQTANISNNVRKGIPWNIFIYNCSKKTFFERNIKPLYVVGILSIYSIGLANNEQPYTI